MTGGRALDESTLARDIRDLQRVIEELTLVWELEIDHVPTVEPFSASSAWQPL
jgi:hypothetical protein